MSIVQFSRLGTYGRFGNQLYQYVFARAFAEKHNATLEVPADWIGRKVFKNINHPPISRKLRRTACDEIPNSANIDLFGYYQSLESLKYLSISKIKEWLQIEDKWLNLFKRERDFYIACHVRRGDYSTKHINVFCVISEDSYIKCCRENNYREEDIIWVKEESPHNNDILSSEGLGFLYDFMILMNADILFRANSSFSYWASILGGPKTYSPIIKDKVGFNSVEFQEGNWEPIIDQKYNKGTPALNGSLYINK